MNNPDYSIYYGTTCNPNPYEKDADDDELAEADLQDQFAARARDAAIHKAITFDALGIMTSGSESRIAAYNFLIRRVLEATHEDWADCRDDLRALLATDAPDYVNAL